VGDIGDVSGLIAAGHNQVVKPLQDQLAETLRVMREVHAELDDHLRAQVGDSYKPVRRDL
jgi:hypothetical protein